MSKLYIPPIFYTYKWHRIFFIPCESFLKGNLVCTNRASLEDRNRKRLKLSPVVVSEGSWIHFKKSGTYLVGDKTPSDNSIKKVAWMYYFRVAAVNIHHKLNGLRQPIFVVHSGGDQRSKISFTGLTSRYPQGYTPSGGFREESVSCCFQFLESLHFLVHVHFLTSLQPLSSISTSPRTHFYLLTSLL